MKMLMKQQTVGLNVLSELRSMKVKRYMLYKGRHDLLNRKDAESVY